MQLFSMFMADDLQLFSTFWDAKLQLFSRFARDERELSKKDGLNYCGKEKLVIFFPKNNQAGTRPASTLVLCGFGMAGIGRPQGLPLHNEWGLGECYIYMLKECYKMGLFRNLALSYMFMYQLINGREC